MKKLLLVLSMTLAISSVMAQKGSWYLGGLAGLAKTTNTDTAGRKDVVSAWSFSPEFGTFLRDDIQIGLAVGLGGESSTFDSKDQYSSTLFNPTIYGRKFFKITDNLSTFSGLYFNIFSGKRTDFNPIKDIETKQSGFGFRIGIGIAYALSPRFTAVGQYGLFGYSNISNTKDGNDAGKDESIDFGGNTVGASTLNKPNGTGTVFNIGLYYTIIK